MTNTQPIHDPTSIVEPTTAYNPPRFKWTKRIAKFYPLFLLAWLILFAVHAWRTHTTGRELQKLIATYQSAGQPILPQDFAEKPVPNKENAVPLLIDAAVSIESKGWIPWRLEEELNSTGDLKSGPAFLEAHREAFSLIRRARSLDEIAWGASPSSPVVLRPLFDEPVQVARSANSLLLAARYSSTTGDDREAFEFLLDVLHIADCLKASRAGIISHIREISTLELLADAIELISCQAGNPSGATVTNTSDAGRARHTTREQITILLNALLDDRRLGDSFADAMLSERMEHADLTKILSDGTLSWGFFIGIGTQSTIKDNVIRLLNTPFWQSDARAILEWFTAGIDAGRDNCYVDAQSMLQDWPEYTGILQRQRHRLLSVCGPSTHRRLLQRVFVIRAKCRMAAAILALRSYRRDHGAYPAALDDLVPDYLPAVPLDPFSCDGNAIAYLPNATPPILYSAGLDGVDNGGNYSLDADGEVDRHSKDLVFFINGDRPVSRNEHWKSVEPRSSSGEDCDCD